MKKLIAMIGAVAMSFGLFAANYAISFEQAEDSQNMGVDTTSMQFTPPTEAGWTWEAEPFALSAYLTGDAFAYGSGAYARRNTAFKDQGLSANANYLPLSTGSEELTLVVGEGNIYLDQLVKFTGFEDPQTNLVAGTKIAVWMSEFENDDESTETNLYVTVGKVDANNVAEQVALKIDGTYSLDTWYRLSIKSLGDIYKGAEFTTPRAAFLVYVNGQQVTVAEEDMEVATALITNVGSMDGIAKGYMAKGQLFTSIAADATFTSVGYQGIGAIDDIIVDAEGPEFCVETVETVDVTFADITGAVITKVVDSDGTVFTDFTSAISVKPGKLTVTLAAAKGYKMTSSGEYIVDVSAAGQLTVKVVEGDFVKVYATKVNGKTTTEYGAAELLTMINNLVNGDVVTFNLGSTITNTVEGAEVTLYSFTADTTITVSVDNGVTTWTIASKTAEDLINDNCGVAENFRKVYELIDDSSSVVFSGEVAGTFKAAYLSNGDAPITLSGAGKVITMSEVDVCDSDNNLVTPTAGVPEADWYTYALSDVPPEKIEYVTFSVTYNTDEVENVTVKTNGADVVDASGVYTVESNAVVTVAATAKTGYQNVTITGDNVTVNAGVFKADKASSVITIAAEEIPPATYGITFATVENGTLETSVTNGIAAGTTVTVIATPATGYECTEITTNGTAIKGTSFEMPADDVAIGATFTLQPVDPETPKHYDSKEAADAAAAEINNKKTTLIKTPEGAVAKDYTDLFTAVVTADNAVVVELNEGGTNALKTAADTIETAVAGKLDDIAATTAGNSVSVEVTVGVQNGFWYGVAATADLTMMGSTEPTKWVQAKNGSVTIQATKPATGNAAFFQTRVKVK